MVIGALPRRQAPGVVGGEGAGRGVENLSSGFMVFKSASLMELNEALRFLSECSMGTQRVLTVWPGRYGQAFVEGRDGSYVSVEPSSSYYNKKRLEVKDISFPPSGSHGTENGRRERGRERSGRLRRSSRSRPSSVPRPGGGCCHRHHRR